jgi:heme exporter protein C
MRRLLVELCRTGPLAVALLAACLVAPTESTMGHVQRILYVHVPVAWLGLLACLALAGSGLAYLAGRDLGWDHWFQAALELGWLCCGLTLVTGSLWAHQAWGTWWVWDPRLTTAFILWAIYSGIWLVRAGIDDPHRRARVGAILAILGVLDVPLVLLATRWFRGLHPVVPEMAPRMRLTLLACLVGFTVFFGTLACRRRRQLALADEAAERGRED